jgi:hypothetical protein
VVVLALMFEVEDFDRYWRIHQELRELQLSHGCTTRRVLRVVGRPNGIMVLLEFPSASDAEPYYEVAVREGALRRAGVLGTPHVEMYEDAREP